MKVLEMYITNQKLSWYIYSRHVQNIFMEDDLYLINDFWHKIKIYNFDPYFWLLILPGSVSLLVVKLWDIVIKKYMLELFSL